MRARLRFAIGSASLLVVLGGVALAQEVGTAGAVNPSSTGTPPSRPTRVLEIGSRVVHKERIATAAGGNVQLVFLDKTTMSIGPNSTVVIDEFVYDPNAGTGRLSASVVKGALRFVGGNTSHSGGAEVKTPSATLGIRGGVATVEVVPCTAVDVVCGTKVTSHFGVLTITSAAGTEVIRRPGFVVTIPNAQGPTAPRRVTQGEVEQANRSLTSKPGQTGGAGKRVTPSVVDRANAAGAQIGQIGATVASVQAQNQARSLTMADLLGLSVVPTDVSTPTQILTVILGTQRGASSARATPTSAGSGNAENPIVTPVAPLVADLPPVVTLPPTPRVPAAPSAYALSYFGANVPATIAGALDGQNSAVLGYADGGSLRDGTANTTTRFLQSGLSIRGQGASQTSSIYVVTGQTFVAPDGRSVLDGGFTGTSRASPNGSSARANGGIVTAGPGLSLDAAYIPTSLTGQQGRVDGKGVVSPEAGSLTTYPGGTTSPLSYQIGASRIPTPAGLGADRASSTSVPNPLFGGLVGGLVTTLNNTRGTSGTTSPVTGLFDLAFNPATSQFGTTLGINSNNAEGNALTSALLDYGKAVDSFFSRPETQDGRGTYIDSRNFAAREARSSTGGQTSAVNGRTVADHRGVFVTSDTVNAKAFFPGVTFCQCEFTRWGFWSSETQRTSAAGESLTDLIHVGTWVFGVPTLDRDMPLSGSATYTGHAIASIQNGSAQYLAAGNFTNAVNFRTGTGAVTVTGLDGRNYAGTVAAGPNGTNAISGTIASPTAGTTMALGGQFFRGASGPAGEMGGTVLINGGPSYVGSGIFNAAGAAPR